MNKRTRIVVDTLLPAGAHAAFGRGALDAGFGSFLETFDRTAPVRLRQGFHVGVAAATWVAPVLIGRVPPITLHRRETREHALQAMTKLAHPDTPREWELARFECWRTLGIPHDLPAGEPAPLILGFVLGPMMEERFRSARWTRRSTTS